MIQPTSTEQETVIQDARALLAQHQPAEAARRLHLHLTTRPGTATAYMLLGVALSGSGEGLRALQAFEQAVAMEPENAAAHYNLGQAYREFGRHREALTEIERALELRPGYPAAARALRELRDRLAPPTSRGLPSAVVPSVPSERTWVTKETEPVDERPLMSRLMAAAWQLIGSPRQAFNGGLDSFFNTPGAVGAVIVFFLLSVGMSTAASLFSAPEGGAGGAIILVLAGAINVVATAGAIATFNRLTGGIGDFVADFGSLALSFALIEATLSLVTMPLLLLAGPLGSASFVTGLAMVVGFWKYCLEVALVMATTEINLFTAVALLAGARFVAQIATVVVFGALLAALLGAVR